LDNEWLTPIFQEEPTENFPPNVYARMQSKLETAAKAFQEELANLKRQQERLEEQRRRAFAVAQDASTFNISDSLREGLQARDHQFLTIKNFERPHTNDKIRNCGSAFIQQLKQIKAAQEELRKNPSVENLNRLQNVFTGFVSPK
jgi:plasmid maintenance system killer protein